RRCGVRAALHRRARVRPRQPGPADVPAVRGRAADQDTVHRHRGAEPVRRQPAEDRDRQVVGPGLRRADLRRADPRHRRRRQGGDLRAAEPARRRGEVDRRDLLRAARDPSAGAPDRGDGGRPDHRRAGPQRGGLGVDHGAGHARPRTGDRRSGRGARRDRRTGCGATDRGDTGRGGTAMSTVDPRPQAGPAGLAGRLPAPLWRGLQQLLAFGSLIVLVVFFSVASGNFFTLSNIVSILLSTAVIGILALGTTFVIITGGIDLSIGTGMTLCSVITGVLIVNAGLPLPVGVLGGILTGALMGFLNGFNITFLGLPPFIATLAMMLVAQGLALVISGVRPIYFSGVQGFREIALAVAIPGVALPMAVVILFAMAAIAWLILSRTILGRYTYAIGSNEEATRLSGINTRAWKIAVYTLAGLFTG